MSINNANLYMEDLTQVLPAEQFPGAQNSPLDYPGLRPEFSYVYYQGGVYAIRPRGRTCDDLWVEDITGEARLNDFLVTRGNTPIEQRRAVLAVGSNGCPGRLQEKYKDQPDVAIPVLVGTMHDTAVVYSRKIVGYGALPATYLHQPEAVSWLSVTMLTDQQLVHMDKTESVGEIYQRISVPNSLQINGGPQISNLFAYLDRNVLTFRNEPIRLTMFARNGPEWPEMDEREVLSLVFDEAGLFVGKSIEERHAKLRANAEIKAQLSRFLESNMGALLTDMHGQLIPSQS